MKLHVATVCAVLALLLRVPSSSGADVDPGAGVQRGLAYLTQEGVRWRNEKKCASCHHVPQMLWALSEARQRGYAIDENAFAETLSWALNDPAARIFPAAAAPAPPPPENTAPAQPPIASIHVLISALALEKLPVDDVVKSARVRLVETMLAEQLPDGSWAAAKGRPPLRDEPFSTTALALWALRSTGDAAEGEAKSAAIDKGEAWLAAATLPESQQALALQLILATRTNGPPALVESLSTELMRRQNPDGGWSQTSDMPSDAFATGQALYALRAAGLTHDDDAMQKGIAFLLAAQSSDGSWPITSRPIPPGTDGASDLAPIRYAAASWGVLGLLAASGP